MVVETGAEARISKVCFFFFFPRLFLIRTNILPFQMLKEQSHESKSIPTEAGEQTTTEHDCGNSQIHAQRLDVTRCLRRAWFPHPSLHRSSSTQMLFATVVIVAAAAIILGIVLSRRWIEGTKALLWKVTAESNNGRTLSHSMATVVVGVAFETRCNYTWMKVLYVNVVLNGGLHLCNEVNRWVLAVEGMAHGMIMLLWCT